MLEYQIEDYECSYQDLVQGDIRKEGKYFWSDYAFDYENVCLKAKEIVVD